MTSRTPMAAQQRQPQRTLSGSSGFGGQRPTHQRSHSQSYLPQSPIRNNPGSVGGDFSSPDGSIGGGGGGGGDGVTSQGPGGRSRALARGGSRLKLEVSSGDIIMNDGPAIESPQMLTPARIMPMNELSDSDHLQRSPFGGLPGQVLEVDTTPLPMPNRRPRMPTRPPPPPLTAMAAAGAAASTGTTAAAAAAAAATAKKDQRPKPYTIQVPLMAPRFGGPGKVATNAASKEPGGGGAKAGGNNHSSNSSAARADFVPWHGAHAEDVFSEAVIRHGHFDKLSSSTQNETASARPALFPTLKQKTGLNALSAVFMSVLHQRRLGGQVTTPSTFKPPPRVTLTDTKREMWLRDLANPAISLRKLSRTIPHGIRGKLLLDHCLNKRVPPNRAVWLAKCVGANELRAFRRKGVTQKFVMGGESKWIRDWTGFVEQFVEGVVFSFGVPDWKAKVTYAIRLATNLYCEHLLDREHYMEWLVQGLENTPGSKLPMWLLISQIYWKDLLRLRKTGRRLVSALLNHLSTIHDNPDRDILVQLSSRLTRLLLPLMGSNAESFISPTTWPKHRTALLESIRLVDPTSLSDFESLDARNESLVGHSNSTGQGSLHHLVKMLDRALRVPFTDDIPAQCWALPGERSALVRGILNWGTSVLRPGRAKVYVAVRILRTCRTQGVDVTSSILEFLDSIAGTATERKQLLYHMVSELVRSSDFVVSRYIQWLIARGGLYEPSDADHDGLCSTRLLVELPVRSLGPAICTTRGNLLRRAMFDVEAERQDSENAFKLVRHVMGLPLEPGDTLQLRKPLSVSKLASKIRKSGRALQTSIGHYLRHDVFGSLTINENQPEMSCSNFNSARAILEAANDYEMLLGVVKSATKAANAELLASCADTINVHLLTFAAIEDPRRLFDGFYESLRTISKEQGLVAGRSLLASLANLAERIPGFEKRAAQLRKDVQNCDRTSAIDACSPVSDNMSGQMDYEGALHEEIEKVLGSGTSVDRPTMDRLFRTVTSRLESSWLKPLDLQRPYYSLLTRLRAFDVHHFDDKMVDWFRRFRLSDERPSLSDILPLLLSQGCLDMGTLLKATLQDLPPRPLTNRPPHLQQVLLTILTPLPTKTALTPEECYRFCVQQQAAQFRYHAELRSLLLASLVEYCEFGGQLGQTNLPLDSPGCWTSILHLVKNLVLADPAALSQSLESKTMNPNSAISRLIETLTTKLLAPEGNADAPVSFDQILEMANELSLPFCRIKLSLGLTPADSGAFPDDGVETRFSLFTKAMDRAIDAKNDMWTSILPHLSDDVAQHLKNEAQHRFMNLIPSLKTNVSGDSPPDNLEASMSLLSVVESITRGHPGPKTANFTAQMVDKLSDMWDILAARDADKKWLKRATLSHWLPLLLRFVALHTNVPEPASAPTPTPGSASIRSAANPIQTDLRARVLISLAGILLELKDLDASAGQPPTAAPERLVDRVLDVALLLVDNFPDDARAQCYRLVFSSDRGGVAGTTSNATPSSSSSSSLPSTSSSASSDPTLQYLFSYTPPPSENLVLALRDRPTPTPAVSPAGQPNTALRGVGSMYVAGQTAQERLVPFSYRRWEVLSEPTPNVGENDTSLSLTLFEAIKIT